MAGLWYEELEEGMVFDHPLSRTITEADNVWFSCLTLNPQPLHIDFHKAAETDYGKPLVNSLFTLGLVIGMTVADTTLGTTVSNLGMTNTTFPAPVFHGDSIHTRTTVISKRPSNSRPRQGIVNFLHEGFNQDDVIVTICERSALMHFKPAADMA